MRQSLQSKFNLLGLIFIAFFLLMLPMFSQVKADTRESLKEARSTALYKWARDMSKDFKPPEDLENTQVEDYWDDYQKEARDANPECPACNPDSDADGDNVTNKDEVEQGRNPLCNEEKYGHEYCQNADPNNLTDPDDVLQRVPVVVLLNATLRYAQNCTGGFGLASCDQLSFTVDSKFRQLAANLTVSDYQGTQWSFQIGVPEGPSFSWQGQTNDNTARTGSYDYAVPTARGTLEPVPLGDYFTQLNVSGANFVGQSPVAGTWEIVVHGIR
jgi:hypothetical protein